MRFATLITAILVVVLGYWAYHQTIQTQMADRDVDRLQREITAQRERLSILNAEWAYLNRPDRLRELAAFNFERLELLPLSPDQFGEAAQIPFPGPQSLIQGNSSLAFTPDYGPDYVEEPL